MNKRITKLYEDLRNATVDLTVAHMNRDSRFYSGPSDTPVAFADVLAHHVERIRQINLCIQAEG